MTPDKDPLEELRGAWDALEPPAPVRRLVDEDERTRAAVGWMAATWNALEVPEPGPLPSAHPSSVGGPSAGGAHAPGFLSRLALALAAALLAWVGFAVSRPSPPSGVSDAPQIPEAPVELAAAEVPRAPIVLAANAERIELRSGSVRLVLLQPLATTAGGTPR